ncbi:WD repeat-containing protein 81-like isoform X2 [Ptychodera flava]|uniref:WD repeat-containing protein 81-like isoform X2 n=1 Tax=Ptychodera flava TaxID=63121 RepID=UPI00396A4A8B
MEEVSSKVSEELGLDANCLQSMNIDGIGGKRSVIALVEESWLHHMKSTGAKCPSPTSISVEDTIQYKPPLGKAEYPWRHVVIQVISKQHWETYGIDQTISEKLQSTAVDSDQQDFLMTMSSIAQENYRSIWEAAQKKYQTLESRARGTESQKRSPANLKSVIENLYGCKVISLVEETTQGVKVTLDSTHKKLLPVSNHSNLVPSLFAVESKTSFYIFHPYREHTLHDAVTFSSAILANSHAKPLFLVYQMLQSMLHCHKLGVVVGEINLGDFHLDEKLWLQLSGPNWMQTRALETEKERNDKKEEEDEQKLRELSDEVQGWVQGKISNYDYLMYLNDLSGRTRGNPNHHPILPWVTDFSSATANYRDLTKSKCRLNKGEDQLDITYEAAREKYSGTIPHHFTELLSDITYHVYFARRTPKEVLCAHVRSAWVPNEYPSSIQRMQEWTPEECIPEFFTDPTVFESLHQDLPDLEVPPWCNSVKEFLEHHRSVLESDHVSSQLHHWIDLTFGYKLSGVAALKAKNVCLQLVDQHTRPTTHGVVQLFNKPHPVKIFQSTFTSRKAPEISNTNGHRVTASVTAPMSQPGQRAEATTLNQAEDIQIKDENEDIETGLPKWQDDIDNIQGQPEEEIETDGGMKKDGSYENGNTSADSDMIAQKKKRLPFFIKPRSETTIVTDHMMDLPQHQSIILPDKYDPLQQLSQLELLYEFCSTNLKMLPQQRETQRPSEDTSQRLISRDIYVFGCLVAEMLLADKLRMQNPHASLWQRYQVVHKTCQTHSHMLPRPIRYALEDILRLGNPPDENFSHEMISKREKLPGPSPSQLLNPNSSVFPFPEYFPNLYNFVCNLQQPLTGTTKEERSIAKIHLAIQHVPKLLKDMDKEGRSLLLPHIIALFSDVDTAPFASLYLFNKVSQRLGPAITIRQILPALKTLFDNDQYTSPVCLLLYHKSFLSQLLTRIGLREFLNHILDFLVEAAAGRKVCPMFNGKENGSGLGQLTRCISIGEDALKSLVDDDDDAKVEAADNKDDKDEDVIDIGAIESDERGSDSRDEESEEIKQSDSSSLDHSFSKDDDDSGSVGKTSLTKDDDTSSAEGVSIFMQNEEEDLAVWRSEELTNRLTEHDGGGGLDNTSVDDTGQDSVEIEQDGYSGDSDGDDNDVETKPYQEDGSDKVKGEAKFEIDSSVKKKEAGGGASSSFDAMKNIMAMEKDSSKLVLGMSLSDVAVDSILWLSQRLGPILTAKYLSKQLLRALTLCYMEAGQLMILQDKPDDMYNSVAVAGDTATLPVLQCLADIAVSYGLPFILNQYVPFIKQVVLSGKSRVNTKVEAGMIASMVLLKYMLVYISDAMLMRQIRDFFTNILQPLISIVASKYISFPGGGHARSVLCYKLVDVMTLISVRIGREMARENMTSLLQHFFCCFDVVHNPDKEVATVESPPTREDRQVPRVSGEAEWQPSIVSSLDSDSSMYCEIQMDSVTNTYTVGTPMRLKDMKGDEDHINMNARKDMFDGLEQGTPLEAAFEELRCVFTEKLAYTTYIPFCRLVGNIHVEKILLNHDLIWKLSSSYESALAAAESYLSQVESNASIGNSADTGYVSPSEDIVSGQFGSNVAMVGNRIELAVQQQLQPQQRQQQLLPNLAEDNLKTRSNELGKSDRTLDGNWLIYWEHCLGVSNQATSFDIHQIKLATYTGHSNTVKSLCVLDNETSFMSASKDKTVKLWSLHNHGNGSARMSCQWTYGLHKKSVFSVNFIESMRYCASCDNTVHVWDPFSGKPLLQFHMSRNPVSVLTSMPAPSTSLLAATVDAGLRVLDLRCGKLQQELKVTHSSSGLIRCVAVSKSGNTVAAGFSSGIVSLVDIRTGLLLGGWKAHEGEVLQVKGYENNQFVTSSINHLTVWGEDGSERAILRGMNEPVHCMNIYQNQVISATTSNRLAIHSAFDGQISYCNKLNPEVFKGILSSFDVLPMNKLLLLGSENGNIYLLA